MAAAAQLEPYAYQEPNSFLAQPMRVLLDARKLGDGGIGVYIRNLIAGLLSNPDVKLSVIAKPGARERFEIPDQVEVIYDTARSYSLDEMFRLSRRIDFRRYDIFHEPHYTLPYGIPIPSVVTIHDLIHLRHPEHAFIPHLARFFIKSAMKRASKILTVSQASYEQLCDFAKGKSDIVAKMSVVRNSLDPFFLQRQDETAAPHQRSCGRYFLAVLSNLKPHKGVPDLLKAFSQIRTRYDNQNGAERGTHSKQASDVKLVLLGEGTENIVERDGLLEQAAGIKGVKIVGKVSKDELKSWYSGALALVVPSKDEGFCLPVIEAQAVGTPVIARPVPAVRELLTENDVLCESFEVEALYLAMSEFLSSTGSGRETNSSKLLHHLKSFSQSELARSVADIYRDVLAKG